MLHEKRKDTITPSTDRRSLHTPTNEALTHTKQITQKNVQDTLQFNNSANIAWFFEDTRMITFFEKHPILWQDLLKKLSTTDSIEKTLWIANKNPNNITVISSLPQEELYELFLVRNGFDYSSKEEFDKLIKTEIIDNLPLIRYANKHAPHSFIDLPTYAMKQWSTYHLKSHIKEAIKYTQSNDVGTDTKLLKLFNYMLPRMKVYMMSIWGINIDSLFPSFKGVASFSSIDVPLGIIIDKLKRNGKDGENAATFLRSFFAWSDLENIERVHRQAKKKIKPFFEAIYKKLWWTITWKNMEFSGEYTLTIPVHWNTGFSIGGSFRLKEIRSILIKLYADRKYTTVDALRDLFGNFIYLDWINESDYATVIQLVSQFMEPEFYFLKNKGLIPADRIPHLSISPLHVSNTKKARTADSFQNLAFSGTLNPVLTEKTKILGEVQFYANKGNAHKKWIENHDILDAKKIIQWRIRGAEFITWPQILDRLTIEMNKKNSSELTPKEAFIACLYDFIIPYRIHGQANIIIFSIKWYEEVTLRRFPFAHKLWKESREVLEKYINWLDWTSSQDLIETMRRQAIEITS